MARPVRTVSAEEPPQRKRSRAELLAGLANQRGGPARAWTDDVDAFTVSEFCARHRISVQVFYKYPDLMPASFYVGSRRLISREAAARWRAQRETANSSKP